MRLLLLLSAILSALTGVAGPRSAVTQPVAASAPVAGQVTRAKVGEVIAARAFAPELHLRGVADHDPAPAALSLRRAYPLYADRRRE